jgi:hypothetical protein
MDRKERLEPLAAALGADVDEVGGGGEDPHMPLHQHPAGRFPRDRTAVLMAAQGRKIHPERDARHPDPLHGNDLGTDGG